MKRQIKQQNKAVKAYNQATAKQNHQRLRTAEL